MDDTFGMLLYQKLSTERKMVAAITNGMSDSVNALIDSGGTSLVNAVLQQQNGRRALHIACQVGRHEYISLFMAAGADPRIVDFFGMMPLDLALRSGHEVCVREMLSVSSSADPLVLWTAQTRAGINAWRSFSTEVIVTLIIATPDFSRCSQAVNVMLNEHFRQPEKYEQLIRIFLLTGNKLTAAQSTEVLGILFPKNSVIYYYSYLSPYSMCHENNRNFCCTELS